MGQLRYGRKSLRDSAFLNTKICFVHELTNGLQFHTTNSQEIMEGCMMLHVKINITKPIRSDWYIGIWLRPHFQNTPEVRIPSLQVSPGTFPNEKVARERSLKFASLTWPTHVALKIPLALKLSTGISFEISGKQPRQKKTLVVKPIENPSSEEKVNVHLVLCKYLVTGKL